MNRLQILQELGITPYIPRYLISNPDTNLTNQGNSSDSAKNTIEVKNQEMINTKDSLERSSSSLPIWNIAIYHQELGCPLLQSIMTCIKKMGVNVSLIDFKDRTLQSSPVNGELLIALGDIPGQYFSNEPSVAGELREIIFETQNAHGIDIPVIVSFGLNEIMKNPIKKSELWNDILMARSVYLDVQN